MAISIAQRRLTRSVDSRTFTENGVITVDMPLGYDQDSVIIKLSGTVTVGTAPTTYHEYAVPRLIKRVDLFSNGKNKYHETTGLMSCLGNFERQLANTLTDITTGTGAKTVVAYFRLDNINADGPRPKDSSLHTVKPFMSKMQLKIALGAMTDMVKTLGPGVFSSFSLTVDVLVEETIEYNDAAFFEDRLVKIESIIEETITATKTSHRVKLPTGELMLRGVKIYALDENGALANTVINAVQLKSGVDVAYSKDATSVREQNKADYRLQGSQQPTGFYFADLCPNGNLNQLWDVRGKSELDLILDVTKPAGGNATLVIVPLHFLEQENSGIRSQVGIA